MARNSFIVAVLLLMAVVCWAGDTPEAPEPIQLNPELLDVKEHTLDNGLRVLMLEDHSTPIVSYKVFYHVGSRDEHAGMTGMAHMFEHMMFRGSKKYGPEEHNNMVKRHGGYCNANTSWDRTQFFENIPSDQLELVVHLEAERSVNLELTPETFEPEHTVVEEERLVRVDNDLFGSAFEQLISNSYMAHPYSWPIIGWMSDLKAYDLERMGKFYRTFYAPNNATIVLAGDFDSDKAIKLIEKYYGNLEAQPQPPQVITQEPPQQGERRIYLHRPAQLPILLASYHIPASTHRDMAALEIAQKILADGQSSRLYKTCVYEQQVAPFAGGQMIALKDPGLFITYIGVIPGRDIEEAEASLFGVIDSLAANGPTEFEMQKARNQLEADFVFSLMTVSGKASQIGETVVTNNGDWRAFTERLKDYAEVTPEDVQRVVATYLSPLNRTVVIVVPDNEAKPVDVSMTGGEE